MSSKKISVVCVAFFLIAVMLSGCTSKPVTSTKSGVAMGSVITVKTYGESEQADTTAGDEALNAISSLDMLISKNNENATLFMLNANQGKMTEVDDELYGYIKQTADIYSLSGGKTAVSSGALTNLWGIDTEDFRLPSQPEIDSALNKCSDEGIVFDDEQKTITVKNGQVLNLGSVGKGIACDTAAKIIRQNFGVSGAVVSVGGSIATVGTNGKSEKWTVGIRNPFGSENEYFAKLQVGEAFISTSGSYEKRFELDGKEYHHILDLTTGYPVENGLCSVTVIAPTGLVSDALSTMCFCLGEEQSRDILTRYNSYAVFVYNDRTVSLSDGLDGFEITDTSFVTV